jgi:hypothetical protein
MLQRAPRVGDAPRSADSCGRHSGGAWFGLGNRERRRLSRARSRGGEHDAAAAVIEE